MIDPNRKDIPKMILTQSNFPRLWLLFQRLIGGTKDKQSIALSTWNGRHKILEIGCSVGNIADAFRSLPGIAYTGIDIDGKAINVAQRRFAGTAFRFLEESIEEHAQSKSRYDYILVAGMLHHVDDAMATDILRTTRFLCSPGATVLIYDPDTLMPSDPALVRWYYKLEQGKFRRPHTESEALIQNAGLHIRDKRFVPIRPGFPGFPPVARFVCFDTAWDTL
jgi:2-polyprenyl-3-methyl-5-hydroxy-6-metoxy-1,4-benzoquinol methylase